MHASLSPATAIQETPARRSIRAQNCANEIDSLAAHQVGVGPDEEELDGVSLVTPEAPGPGKSF